MREDHKVKGNTVGSQQRIAPKDLSYIAGFLDGDGSIMVQVKNRRGTPRGWRLMCTICFYQDTHHKKPLRWIRNTLGIGYLSNRNDHITELRINGFVKIQRILMSLKPYIKFKARQVELVLHILSRLEGKRLIDLPRRDRLRIAGDIIRLRKENYKSHTRKYDSDALRKIFGSSFLSDPVTTDSRSAR